MERMKRYDQIFSLEINKSREEIISILEKRGKVTQNGESVSINHNPPWYKVFAGRGIVTLVFNKADPGVKKVVQCILSPSVADPGTIFFFLLWNIPLWAAFVYLFPWNPLLLIVFFIEWLMMAFIAIPVLFLTVFVFTAYLFWISFSWPIVFFVLITWSFLLLLVNAALRYNRGELKKWVVRLFILE